MNVVEGDEVNILPLFFLTVSSVCAKKLDLALIKYYLGVVYARSFDLPKFYAIVSL